MNLQMTGKLIANARKECGYTQKELAAKLSISDRTVSKWERGVGFPDVSLLEPLADSLNITVSEIVMGEKSDSEISAMSDDEILKAAAAIIKTAVVKQLHKLIVLTSLATVFPFLIGVFFWSHIPNELAILVGASSPYVSKLFTFTILPVGLLILNVITVLFIQGKALYPYQLNGLPNPYRFHFYDPPTNTLFGKIYFIFKHVLYCVVPVTSWTAAVCTYILAFRGTL